MTTVTPTIVTEGLHKYYGKVHALDGLDLVAEQGSVLGVLGPNGSGKTTTVRILTTLLKPDRGRAEVEGLNVVKQAAAVRSRIGLTGQYAAVDESLTGYENLKMFTSPRLCVTWMPRTFPWTIWPCVAQRWMMFFSPSPDALRPSPISLKRHL